MRETGLHFRVRWDFSRACSSSSNSLRSARDEAQRTVAATVPPFKNNTYIRIDPVSPNQTWLRDPCLSPLCDPKMLPTAPAPRKKMNNRSTAEMICAGVLPIMQMRNVMPPMALIARRIPRHILEITYTIKLPVLPGDAKDAAGNAMLSPQQLLESYCQARGLFRARALGESDMPRAARQILKDFTDGRLLFCHPPAGQAPEVRAPTLLRRPWFVWRRAHGRYIEIVLFSIVFETQALYFGQVYTQKVCGKTTT